MYNQGPDFFTILLYIIAGFISVLIIRWIFSIGRIVDNLEKQNGYLKLIAEKMQVDEDEILRVHDYKKYIDKKAAANKTNSN